MIHVYGHSEDRIAVEGDVNGQFNPPADTPVYLAFSDGTLLCVKYNSDGEWVIRCRGYGQASVAITPANLREVPGAYSDLAEIDGVVNWVLMGTEVVA
jgi:hypothetical protein